MVLIRHSKSKESPNVTENGSCFTFECSCQTAKKKTQTQQEWNEERLKKAESCRLKKRFYYSHDIGYPGSHFVPPSPSRPPKIVATIARSFRYRWRTVGCGVSIKWVLRHLCLVAEVWPPLVYWVFCGDMYGDVGERKWLDDSIGEIYWKNVDVSLIVVDLPEYSNEWKKIRKPQATIEKLIGAVEKHMTGLSVSYPIWSMGLVYLPTFTIKYMFKKPLSFFTT